jgi:putative transposase
MAKRKIPLQAGYYYHLYNRGHNYQDIFFNRENYLYFLRQFRQYLIPDTLDVISYCLMPNHYHFIVYLKTDDFTQKIQPFILSYSKAINKQYQRVGSLFQGKYQAIIVDKDEYLLHLSRYINLNPVQANLVSKAEDWEFSSYPEYLGIRQGTLPQTDIILSQFTRNKVSPGDLVAKSYGDFVESYQPQDQQLIQHLTLD